jgi:uncharacterized protein involved in exopolysaccharide biosynthesis
MELVDYWRIVWRAKLGILALALLAAVVGLVYGRMQPKVYTTTATILAPKDAAAPSLSGSLGALLGGGGRDGGGGLNFSAIVGGVPTTSPNTDMFVALLKSRSLRQEVVEEAKKPFGPDVGGKIVSVTPNTREKGVIGLTVEANDPQVAAGIANLYFMQLDRMTERNAEQATQRQKAFYGEQLQRAAREVAAAEEALLRFQSENHIVPTDAGKAGGGTADPGSQLRKDIQLLEMQREVMRMKLTDEHPHMRDINKQIAELKKQYAKNLFGQPMDLPAEGVGGRSRKEFFVSTEKMTPVQFANLKLIRNLKIQEAFYTGALQGLEQIKYTDATGHARVEFLDPALVPGAPIRPNVRGIVQAAAGAGLLVGVLGAFTLEYLKRMQQENRRKRRAEAPARGGRTEPRVAREPVLVGPREPVGVRPE